MRRHVDQARAAGLQLCDVGAGQRLVARERDPFRRALAQPRIQRGDAVAAQLQQLELAQRVERREIADRVTVEAQAAQSGEDFQARQARDARLRTVQVLERLGPGDPVVADARRCSSAIA